MKHKTLLFHLFPQIHHCPIRYRAIDQYFHFSSLFFVLSLFQRTTKRTSGRGPLYIELTQMSERTEASDFRKRDRTRRSSRGKTRFHSIVLEGTADSTFTIERFQNAARDTSREQLFLLGRKWRKIVRDNDRAWKNVWFYISDFQCGIYRGISRLKENLFYFLQYTLSVF